MLLLTDGSVMVHDAGPAPTPPGTSNWWRLRPDKFGSYVNGTWSQIASMPSGYEPLSFASAVLPDGRVIVEGGEFNNGSPTFTNRGAIYDPVANTWTEVAPPGPPDFSPPWSSIGDAPSTVLADGRFMLGQTALTSVPTAEALLHANDLTWTSTGVGKADGNAEEGFTLLPNDKVLTVDTKLTPNAEIYTPSTGTWTPTSGPTPASLVQAGEIGPQVLRPNGTVIAFGGNAMNGANAIYDSASDTWSAGPSFPQIDGRQYVVSDGPASILPNGAVLVDASPGYAQSPAHFFVFDGATLTQVADSPLARLQSSNYGVMLVLPTGQVLFNFHFCQMYVYNAGGQPRASWRPKITSVPTALTPGRTYTVAGTQLNGLTQGAAFGDDIQNATNYPLVRITMNRTGHVFYARTFGMTSMSVAPNTLSSAKFRVPPGIEIGNGKLAVVANGIASKVTAVVT